MKGLGIHIGDEVIENLLATVMEDDCITMMVVFRNVKEMTLKLQELTEESKENLDIAKRYYGFYVVLTKILDRLQKGYIRTIEEEHIPKLEGFIEEAERIRDEAHRLIAKNGDNREILEQNIESNELTIRAATTYIHYLREHADVVRSANERVVSILEAAINTYDTVKVSSNVISLLREGSSTFEALMQMELPRLRGFQNRSMKNEFERLTQQMRLRSEPL